MNLAAIYFCEQQQISQIEFRKFLAKTLMYHYNEETDETPDKKQKHWETSHCLIMLSISKKFWECKSSLQTVHIHKTNAQPVPVAFVPQASFSVQNVLDIILPVPRTVFQHQAEFSQLKGKKRYANDVLYVFVHQKFV